MLIDENCLLISGQRARVGVPGATKYGIKRETRLDIERKYREEKPKIKTIPDKPYLRVEREPILLIYIMKIDKQKLKPKVRKFNSDQEAIDLVGDIPVIGLGLGFPGNYNSKTKDSQKVKYVLNKISENNMLNFEEDDEDED